MQEELDTMELLTGSLLQQLGGEQLMAYLIVIDFEEAISCLMMKLLQILLLIIL